MARFPLDVSSARARRAPVGRLACLFALGAVAVLGCDDSKRAGEGGDASVDLLPFDGEVSTSPPPAPCPVQQQACFEQCIDVENDPENCGQCGQACPGNDACTNGACVVRCRDVDLAAPAAFPEPCNHISPGSLIAVDLDQDGADDFVRVCADNLVVALTRDGGRRFERSVVPYSTNGPHGQVSVGDLDGDGDLDLTWPDEVLRNDGAGRVSLVEPPHSYERIAIAADLDGDGIDDRVIAGNRLALSRALGGMQFEAPVEIDDAYPQLITAADLDGDGRDEVVAVTNDEIYLVDRADDGSGFVRTATLPLPGAPRSLVTLDVDDDGHLDVVLGTLEDTFRFVGDGNGGLADPVSLGFPGRPMIATDIDSDGTEELLLFGGVTELRRSRGDGTFGDPQVFDAGEQYAPAALARLGQSGRRDLVAPVGGDSRHWVAVFPQTDGGFEWTDARALAANLPGEQSVRVADVDGDGLDDLIVLAAAGELHVMLGRSGSGPLLRALPPARPDGTGRYFAVADLDGDGALDLVRGDIDGLWLLTGRGDGTFAPSVALEALGRPEAVVRHGGQPYLVTSGSDRLAVHAWQNGEPVTTPAATLEGYRVLDVADVDGDGNDDLLFDHNGTRIALGTGGGRFGEPRSVYDGVAAGVIGDATGDGHADLVLDGGVVVPGDGRGGFGEAEALRGAFARPFAARQGRVYGAGLDAIGVFADGELEVWPLQGSWGAAAGDFDGDGQLDVVAPSRAVRWRRGAAAGRLEGEPRALPNVQEAVVVRQGGDAPHFLAVVQRLPGDSGHLLRVDADGAVSTLAAVSGARGLGVVDFEGDGGQELLVSFAGIGGENGAWIVGSDGSSTHVGPHSGQGRLLALQLDDSGWVDLVTPAGMLLLSHGPRGPWQGVDFSLAGKFPLLAADFDGDGREDLVVRDYLSGGLIEVLPGLPGQIGLGEPRALGVGGYPVAADFDGDGIADLALVDGQRVELLYGPTLATRASLELEVESFLASAVDLDGDGLSELLVDEGGTTRRVVLRDGTLHTTDQVALGGYVMGQLVHASRAQSLVVQAPSGKGLWLHERSCQP